MKKSLLNFVMICLLLALHSPANGQLKVVNPVLWYVGKWDYADVVNFKVGSRSFMKQLCTPDAPETIVNGTILFENVYLDGDSFSIAVDWKDSLVSSHTYYIKSSQMHVLKKFGIDDITAVATGIKGEWVYSRQTTDQVVFIVGNRKTITAQIKALVTI